MHSIGSDNAALGKCGKVWNGCAYISTSLWQGYKNFKEVECLWTSMQQPDESGRRTPMQKLNMNITEFLIVLKQYSDCLRRFSKSLLKDMVEI